jgi:hypothetical protein
MSKNEAELTLQQLAVLLSREETDSSSTAQQQQATEEALQAHLPL